MTHMATPYDALGAFMDEAAGPVKGSQPLLWVTIEEEKCSLPIRLPRKSFRCFGWV